MSDRINSPPNAGLTVLLPPPQQSPRGGGQLVEYPVASSSGSATPPSDVTPPPRPPPPRVNQLNHSGSPNGFAATAFPTSNANRVVSMSPNSSLPQLPPKQSRSLSQSALLPAYTTASCGSGQPLNHSPSLPPFTVPTAYPAPPNQPVATTPKAPPSTMPRQKRSSSMNPAPTGTLEPQMGRLSLNQLNRSDSRSEESKDNASNECAVCLEKPTDCVLYMCGHMCLCYECAVDIKQKPGATCPICRQPIKDIIKIFRS